MRNIFKKAVQYYLKFWAKIALAIHQPMVIAIAGTTNKTFIKEAILQGLLARNIDARSSLNGFNTEFGLPLSILNLPSGFSNAGAWLPVIKQAPASALMRPFPKYLILELGISAPGDMKYLLSIIKPRVSVCANLTQRYLESFEDIHALTQEFAELVKRTDKNGLVLINSDVSRLLSLKDQALGDVKTFGLGMGADLRAKLIDRNHIEIISAQESEAYSPDRPGQHHLYALLASKLVLDYIASNETSKSPQ